MKTKKENSKIIVNGLVVVAGIATLVTAGLLAAKYFNKNSNTIEATHSHVAVSTTVENTKASAPTQTQTAAQTQTESEAKATAPTVAPAKATEVKNDTTPADAKVVMSDPTLNKCVKTQSASFEDEVTSVVKPQIDLHLVSKDGKIDTWTSINANGDLYNAKGERFKGNGDGTFYDVNGVVYDVVQVNRVVE